MLFDPAGWRPHIANCEVVARSLLARIQQEAIWNQDSVTRELVNAILWYHGAPARWSEPDFELPQDVISVWLMTNIGAVHPGGQPEVGALVILPIGVARTLSTRWRSIERNRRADLGHDVFS